MKFFFDNCVSPSIVQILRELKEDKDHTIVHLRERFDPDTPDREWIEELASEGDWIIISNDSRIRKSPHTKEIWRRSGLTGFYLTSQFSNAPLRDQAMRILERWPEIVKQASRAVPGTAFEVGFGKNRKKFKELR